MHGPRISKRIKTQVAVIGGGTAGAMAALGARNAGVDVTLVEKNAVLGGTMTQGMVCFPGLFHAWGRQIIGGYGYEAVRRTLAYEGGKVFDDAVCYAFYPVDLHTAEDRCNTGGNLYNIFLKDGVVPTVPYRALIPRGSDDLLCAGRIICSDQLANSGLRVQATCMAVGQAAGVAAAIAASRAVSVREVPYADLCAALKRQGAIVPERA